MHKTLSIDPAIVQLIETAIQEDIGLGDLTSEALVPKEAMTTGRFVLKQAGVVAGLPLLEILFHKIDPLLQITLLVEEGSYQKAGTLIASVTGHAQGILSGERIALNLIQHTSGIASVTSQFVKKIKGLPCKILDTRKTLPGLRALEKYAVRVGGGTNHRFSLDERFIIKNNHLSFLVGKTSSPLQEAVKRARTHRPDLPIEIEITRTDQLPEVLETGIHAVMLTSISPQEVKRWIDPIRKKGKKVYIRSPGATLLETIRNYAETGIDGISIDSLTHSVPALDIVMRL